MSHDALATCYLVGALRVFLRDCDGALLRVECAALRTNAVGLYRQRYRLDAVAEAQARHAARPLADA